MLTFNLKQSTFFAIDTLGVSILNNEAKENSFIKYPEAAVWLVFIEGHSLKSAVQLLAPILGKTSSETKNMVIKCLEFWKDQSLIE
jgi:hypothetical protein